MGQRSSECRAGGSNCFDLWRKYHTTFGYTLRIFKSGQRVVGDLRMRILTAGSIAFIVVAASLPAMAADLTPMVKAAPAPVMAVPPFNWNGIYIGVHLGGAWASRDFTQTNTLFPATVEGGTITSSGIVGGGQIGWNWQFAPNWLLGVEADVSAADLNGSVNTSPAVGPAVVGWNDKTDLFGTVRGRLGYVWNNWMIYGTGGFAWADNQFTRTQLVAGPNSPAAGLVNSNSQTATGWVAGVGAEWGFARNWTARIEYLHIDVGGTISGFSAPVGVAGAVGVNTFGINESDLTIDTVRAGVNWLFNY
jgi:outer membrane immunogenic protein